MSAFLYGQLSHRKAEEAQSDRLASEVLPIPFSSKYIRLVFSEPRPQPLSFIYVVSKAAFCALIAEMNSGGGDLMARKA